MIWANRVQAERPFFSIVLPTRNRGDLLRTAIQSVLDQAFVDYELVVSDNASTDETPEVVGEHGDQRIRNVRTPEPLSQADSWEFALDQARGEYVTFLGDDDAICPDLLGRVARVIADRGAEVVTWELGRYHSNRSSNLQRVNAVEFCPFDRRINEIESRLALGELYSGFRLLDEQKWPILNNAAYHRDVIARVKKRLSRFFHPVVSDISSCIATLTQVDHYPHICDPLALKAIGNESLSRQIYASEGREAKLRSEFGENAQFKHVPLKSNTAANSVFETLLIMKEKLVPELTDLEISWESYFVSCFVDLLRLKHACGIDVSAALGEFNQVMAQQPPDLQGKVQLGLASSRLKQLITLESLEPNIWVVHGDQIGFNSILECARVLSDTLRSEMAQYWRGERTMLPIPAEPVTQSTWLWGAVRK